MSKEPAMKGASPTIRTLTSADVAAAADLHGRCIDRGFLVRLGPRFLRQLYRYLAEADAGQVWVAIGDDGRVIGVCAYARDVRRMYRSVLRRGWFWLALATFPNSLRPRMAKGVLDVLRYPRKVGAKQLPPAEILSIAVDPSVRGGGVGRALLERAVEQARLDGQEQIKVLAGVVLVVANRFYQACGFEKIDELSQHGGTLNVYARRT
jgi:GNAT superfamily N-acetyltransferase